MLGAAAVQIGTAFLACEESGAAAAHRSALFTPTARRTALTRAFSGRLVRAIPNRYMKEVEARPMGPLPYPAQNWLSGTMRAAATTQGRSDFLSLQAGQSASLIRHRSAAALIEHIVSEVPSVTGRLA